MRGGLFDKSRDLLAELETSGHAEEEVIGADFFPAVFCRTFDFQGTKAFILLKSKKRQRL